MRLIAVDTSSVIAAILAEPERRRLVELTKGAMLIAPQSLKAEIGNAFSAMFKKKRIPLKKALQAVRIFEKIPIRFSEIDLRKALEIAHQTNIYAYDAYILECAISYKAPILTLDAQLKQTALAMNVKVLEV
jgi:predicted nucleic acid-binding protein